MGWFTVGTAVREKGQRSELFFPATVKSCSSTVDNVVRRGEYLTFPLEEMLLPLPVTDPSDLPDNIDRRCAAFLPSLMVTAVCCLEFVCPRSGNGTKPATGEVTCRSGGSCSFAKVLDISESPDAYLSARC